MRESLNQGLPQLGVDTSCIPALEEFSRLLLEKNQVMNLTAITEPRDVATLHLLDSLSLVPLADWRGKRVVDVGFLRESCAALGLAGVDCVHSRAEEFAAGNRESFDLAVSRAVAALPVLCELCLPLVKVGGQFLAMKSSHTEEEISQAKSAIATLGGKIREVRDYTIPTTDVVHRVVVIEKVSPTPKKYPRRFAQIKKQPLGQPGGTT